MDDEITCPACGECGLFTLHDDGACPSARCQNCQHRIGVIVLERGTYPR
jgi:DNA-directed RNA polymerase subunit RPC12/RpoP